MTDRDPKYQGETASWRDAQADEVRQERGSTRKALRESGAVVLPTAAAQGIDPVAHMDGVQTDGVEQASLSVQSDAPTPSAADMSQPPSNSE